MLKGAQNLAETPNTDSSRAPIRDVVWPIFSAVVGCVGVTRTSTSLHGLLESVLNREPRTLRVDVGRGERQLARLEQLARFVAEQFGRRPHRLLVVGGGLRHCDRQHAVQDPIQVGDGDRNGFRAECFQICDGGTDCLFDEGLHFVEKIVARETQADTSDITAQPRQHNSGRQRLWCADPGDPDQP